MQRQFLIRPWLYFAVLAVPALWLNHPDEPGSQTISAAFAVSAGPAVALAHRVLGGPLHRAWLGYLLIAAALVAHAAFLPSILAPIRDGRHLAEPAIVSLVASWIGLLAARGWATRPSFSVTDT